MNELTGIAMTPDDRCDLCMKSEEEAGELLIHQVSYSYSSSQRRLCHECRAKVATAIEKALEGVGWH